MTSGHADEPAGQNAERSIWSVVKITLANLMIGEQSLRCYGHAYPSRHAGSDHGNLLREVGTAPST